MTTIDKKIKKLLELCDTFLFVEYYSHTKGDMYKIENPFTHYAKEILVLGFVDDGIEKSLDSAMEQIAKKREEFYGENNFNSVEFLKIDSEPVCSCKVGEPYNNLCCPVHGKVPKLD